VIQIRKTTIKDIAREAGVSVSTVSNVINGKASKVSDETIQRIQKVIKDLNYIPNFSARSLVRNRSNLIGVIIPQTEDYKQLLLQNPFYSEIVSGIEYKTREYGYNILLSGLDKDKSILELLIRWNVDAAIIMGAYKEQFYEDLKEVKIPITLIDSYINDDYFYKIGIDDEEGGYLATKYLIDCGHRNIALVTGSIKKEGVTEKRFLGYKRALKEGNIFYNPDYVLDKSVSYEHGVEAGVFIAEKLNEATAVFATADLIAAGVISGLKVSGKEVPEDISVVGFDDVNIARMLVPPLTTVKQHICEKGIQAVEQLMDVLEGFENPIGKEILLQLQVVERQSVRKINK
jgi:DNA-binding LacI/PurR family transcriptional regulator